MKRTARILFVLIAMFSMQSFTNAPSASDTIVYVTPSGKCYHSTKSCSSLSMYNKIFGVSLCEAKNSRRACSKCY